MTSRSALRSGSPGVHTSRRAFLAGTAATLAAALAACGRALGVYTLGVLGRLAAEAVEEADERPRAALTALGARPAGRWLYGVVPQAAGPVLAFALYRWEVAVRDTLLVGLLGAGGLGALLASRLAVFDWPAVTTVLLATIALTLAVDLVGDRARRALR